MHGVNRSMLEDDLGVNLSEVPGATAGAQALPHCKRQ
jgi:hypothetical protein